MKRLTMGQRIVAGFAAIVLISAVLGLFAFKQLQTISGLATVTTADCLEGIDALGRIESVTHENNILLVKNLMTKNEELRAGFEGQIQTNLQQIASVSINYQNSQRTADGRNLFNAFDVERQNYVSSLNQVLKLTREGKTQEAM